MDCSMFQTNPGCDGMVCNTDWTMNSSAQIVRDSFCKPFTNTLAKCGVTCGPTKWGSDCCTRSDFQTCFSNLAKNGCPNGGSNGMGGKTHALGQTSVISTLTGGHAAQVTSMPTTVSTSVSGTSSHSAAAQTTGSSTVASNPAATSKSSAERSISLGSKLTVYVLVAGILANFLS